MQAFTCILLLHYYHIALMSFCKSIAFTHQKLCFYHAISMLLHTNLYAFGFIIAKNIDIICICN